MTQKISKGLYAFITLTILLVGAFFMVKAVSSEGVVKSNLSEVPHYYTGPDSPSLNDLQDLGNWSTEQETNHTCGEESEAPCFIMADSESSLNNKLQSATSVEEILDQSPFRRENN